MFAKVFCQIFDSSIADNWKHRHVFQDLLILADRYGIVDMTPEAICARTRLPREMVDEAIAALSSPDPRSRSREEEGRRIVPIDPERPWGWRIVNYLKYREMRTEFDRTGYMRDYMRNYRQLNSVKPQSNGVKLSASASSSSGDGNGSGKGKGPRKFVSELKTQITEAEKERERLKQKGANESPTGTEWHDANSRTEFIALGKKIKEWTKEILEQ